MKYPALPKAGKTDVPFLVCRVKEMKRWRRVERRETLKKLMKKMKKKARRRKRSETLVCVESNS